MLSKKDYFL